ncbi:MAG: hypothetical protein Q4C52_01165 [Eubacteriales bacterium]|nr:hypothetical protein [Eubacteriales bacterium]
MNWLDKLERRFGRYAIHNLMYYIIILYAVGFVLQWVSPTFYYKYLCLDAGAILHGQIWRIVTFLIQPPSSNLLFFIVTLYCYYLLGSSLERTWGAFRFNMYFFGGVLFHVAAAILVYLLTGLSLPMGTSYLNLSLFFAFAALYPDLEFLLFFIIPVKAKWLALVDGIYFLYTVLQAFLPAYGGGVFGILYKANALAAAISILNFVIFFLGSRNMKPYTPKERRRKREFRQKMRPTNQYADGARHRCAVCGRTDATNPELEFRYCSRCNGDYEYCQDHLFTHTHIK